MIKIGDWFTEFLRRKLLAHEAPGTRVLRSGWPVAVQRCADRVLTTTVAGADSVGGTLRLAQAGEDPNVWGVEMTMNERQTFASDALNEKDARALYVDMQRQLLANAPQVSRGGAGAFRWAALITGALVILVIVSSLSRNSSVVAATRSSPAAATVASSDARVPRVTETEMTMLRTAASRGGINLGDSGTPFYVFSDPLCPYCQKLEHLLEQVGGGHKAVILPVAYKPGAKDVAQAILCTKDQKEANRLWRQALANPGDKLDVPANAGCGDGLALLTDNMTLFQMFKLSGTPTIITASGRMFSGTDDGTTVEQLRVALELP